MASDGPSSPDPIPRDDAMERQMLGRSPRFRALLDRSRGSIEQGRGPSEKGFWAAVRRGARSDATQSPRPRRRKRAT